LSRRLCALLLFVPCLFWGAVGWVLVCAGSWLDNWRVMREYPRVRRGQVSVAFGLVGEALAVEQ
jgi:hypothetical protein